MYGMWVAGVMLWLYVQNDGMAIHYLISLLHHDVTVASKLLCTDVNFAIGVVLTYIRPKYEQEQTPNLTACYKA